MEKSPQERNFYLIQIHQLFSEQTQCQKIVQKQQKFLFDVLKNIFMTWMFSSFYVFETKV